MSGTNPQHEFAAQLYTYVITPALSVIGFNDPASRALVLATACQESGLQAIAQRGNGPAISLWQIEPATVRDTMTRLPHSISAALANLIYGSLQPSTNQIIAQLPGNLYLGAAMCRLVYYMKPFKMPIAPTGSCLAHIYKLWYNSPAGAATEAEFVAAWDRFGLDSIVSEGNI